MALNDRRERLFWTAQRLGLDFPSSISDNDLGSLIKRQPATARQRKILSDFLKSQPGNRTLPPGLTFGRAGELIQELMELLNQRAIMELGLSVGDVVRWRSTYFYVQDIGSARSRYKMQLQQVGLWRAPGSPRAEFAAAKRKPFWTNPVTLRYEGVERIDLTKWRLPASAEKLFQYKDEPPF